ncbi:MAG TPA: hypothetical protein VF695_13800 [Sphingomonas sp.]|jgi:hypothetical protein
MRVKTIKDHRNEFGDKWEKKGGDEYEVTDTVGVMLVASELVEKIEPVATAKG